MKRLLTAAIAATLIGGVAAYAQDNSGAAAPAAPAAADQSGAQAPSPAMAPGSDQGAGAAPAAGADQGSAPPPAAGADQGAAGASASADAPAGAPPSSYPPCTSKGQDRCVQSGKMAKSGGHHTAKHKKSKKAAG